MLSIESVMMQSNKLMHDHADVRYCVDDVANRTLLLELRGWYGVGELEHSIRLLKEAQAVYYDAVQADIDAENAVIFSASDIVADRISRKHGYIFRRVDIGTVSSIIINAYEDFTSSHKDFDDIDVCLAAYIGGHHNDLYNKGKWLVR